MDVLHLSDLHATEVESTLDTVWTGVPAAIAGRKFDAIIVSGDLTRRAARHEYEALHAFSERTLLPLLTRQEHRRIVFVPGNHDVSWTFAKAAFTPLDAAGVEAIAASDLEQHQANPDHSSLRMELSQGRQARWYRRISEELYATRFQEFQRFISRFYNGRDCRPGSPVRSAGPRR